jgi:hypothetical protein
VLQHPEAIDAFFSVLRKTPSGRRIIVHYPIADTRAAERFFCVRDDPFERVQPTLNLHERCPAGWYEQLFNLFLRISVNTHQTLRLGGASK